MAVTPLTASSAISGRDPALAGDAIWWKHVPLLHRVLANPQAAGQLPDPPDPEAAHEDYLAYWLPPYYLMTYLLGWARPDFGLSWWLEADRPTDRFPLPVLRHGWDGSNQLDLLAAWVWSSHMALDVGRRLRHICDADREDDRPQLRPESAWQRDFEARFPDPYAEPSRAFAQHDPVHGGIDPLHLSAHVSAPLEEADGTSAVALGESNRRAVVVLESMPGWYARMVDLVRAFDPATEVDVFCKPVGWLGTFHRSPESDIWHAVSEDLHTKGI